MKVKLVFFDWHNRMGESIYHTPIGVELSLGSFHSGTIFDAEIQLNGDEHQDLTDALNEGFIPVFYVIRD